MRQNQLGEEGKSVGLPTKGCYVPKNVLAYLMKCKNPDGFPCRGFYLGMDYKECSTLHFIIGKNNNTLKTKQGIGDLLCEGVLFLYEPENWFP